MILMARLKDVLLKETASEVSKQTGLSTGATGVQSARLTRNRLQHRQPKAPGMHTIQPNAPQDSPAGLRHPPGSHAHGKKPKYLL